MATSAAVIEALARLGSHGAVVVIGTCDVAGVPEVSRGWGFRVLPAGDAIEVCVYERSGQRTLANLAENSHAAVTITSPTTYHSIQVKGRARVAAAADQDVSGAAEHQRAFVEEVVAVGLPREMAPRLFEDEMKESPAMMKIMVGVEELFDQRPGPGAGARL